MPLRVTKRALKGGRRVSVMNPILYVDLLKMEAVKVWKKRRRKLVSNQFQRYPFKIHRLSPDKILPSHSKLLGNLPPKVLHLPLL
jgi:hypothetical protein